MTSEWISVQDRLPDLSTVVLAAAMWNGSSAFYVVEWKQDHGDDDPCFYDVAWDAKWADPGEITHWTPIPKLPEDDSDD